MVTKGVHKKTEQKIQEILEPEERLIACVAGYQYRDNTKFSISFGNFPFELNTIYYLGLTTKDLILREENVGGNVRNVQRIPLEQRKWAELNPARSLDKLTLMWEERKCLELLVFSQQRQDTKAIIDVFRANQASSRSDQSPKHHSQNHLPLNALKAYWGKGGLSTGIISALIFILGLVLVFVVNQAFEIIFPSNRPEILGDMLRILLFFVLGFIGVVFVKRKEIPGLFTIRGKLAVILGVIYLIFTWGVALLSLFDVIKVIVDT